MSLCCVHKYDSSSLHGTPPPPHVSYQDRLQEKVGLFKLAELRAVLRYAGLKRAGNKSRVLQSVRDVITQDNQLAIANLNVIYSQV